MSKKRQRKNTNNTPRKPIQYEQNPITSETKKGIIIVLILVIAFLTILSLFNLSGSLGLYLKQFLGTVFGGGLYLFPIILIGLQKLKRTLFYSFEPH